MTYGRKHKRPGLVGEKTVSGGTPPMDRRWDLPCDIDPVPCGFCGRRGLSLGIVKNCYDDFSVECDCGARGPSGITPKRAIERWNAMKEVNRRRTKASGVGWYVRWRERGEREVGRREPELKDHTDLYCAPSMSDALAVWCRQAYNNAEVLAVWRADVKAYWLTGNAPYMPLCGDFPAIDDPQNGGTKGGDS